MKPQSIKINIIDDEKFGEVAFFVDKDGFLKDVSRIRELIGLKDVIDYGRYDRILKKRIDGQISYLGYSPENLDQLLDFIARKIRKNNHKPFFFDPIVKRAIVCGEIRDRDFQKIGCELIYLGSESEETDWDRKDFLNKYDPSIAIIFTPQRFSGKLFEEIREVYNNQVPDLISKYKALLGNFDSYTSEEGLNEANKLKVIPPDTAENIRRDREWYWLRKEGKRVIDIALATPDVNEQGINPSNMIETVRIALRRYRKKLKTNTYNSL